MDPFVAQHRQHVTAVLNCFDRIVFKGHLPLQYGQAMEAWLRHRDVPLPRFGRYVETQSDRLRAAAEQWAQREGRPCSYDARWQRKERWAHQIAERDRIGAGLVAVLRTTENGNSFRLVRGRWRPHLVRAMRRALHLYFFLEDPQLGWLHIRLQTWFPFQIQIAVNGHSILARQLDRRDIGYQRVENGFRWLEDPTRAQRLAGGMAGWDWARHLNRLAALVNPLLHSELRGLRYHWVIDQCELATDVLFDRPAHLGPLYTELVRHATLCFRPRDILGFFGRPLHGLFQGEVHTETQQRDWGLRLKHRVGRNWLKMYNKAGAILRIETVINRAQDFRIFRPRRRRDGTVKAGVNALPKAVGYLPAFWKIQVAANRRYLAALAAVEDLTAAYAEVDHLGQVHRVRGQRVRALNPLTDADRRLLQAVVRPEYLLRGFRNADIAAEWHGPAPADPRERRRLSARVRRQLLLLRGHRLIRRLPGTRRYRLTALGQRLIPAVLGYVREDVPRHALRPAA